MKYPVLTPRAATAVADRLLAADESLRIDLPIAEGEFVQERDGDRYPRDVIETVAHRLRIEWEKERSSISEFTNDDLYLMEIKFAARIHELLSRISLDLREDEDFWRYLALFPFRWYLIAREGTDFKPQDYGGTVPGLSAQDLPSTEDSGESAMDEGRGTRLISQVIYRAYLIGKSMYDPSDSDDPYRRANAIPRGGPVTDIWQSHVIRVQIGRIGEVPHAFIDHVSRIDKSSMKDDARLLAKAITRRKTNISLDGYTKSETDTFIANVNS